jgi:hypothetical protein
MSICWIPLARPRAFGNSLSAASATLFADVDGEGDTGLAFDGAGNLYYGGGHLTGFIGKISPDGVALPFNPQPVSQPRSFAFTDDNGVPVPLANQTPAPEPVTWMLLGLGSPRCSAAPAREARKLWITPRLWARPNDRPGTSGEAVCLHHRCRGIVLRRIKLECRAELRCDVCKVRERRG